MKIYLPLLSWINLEWSTSMLLGDCEVKEVASVAVAVVSLSFVPFCFHVDVDKSGLWLSSRDTDRDGVSC
jgi:hypothetical protein